MNKNEEKFKIYRSSAGSGKTYTLVKEFLSILLSSEDPMLFKKVLAITFTNKAASEMKERVLNTLSEIESGENEQLLKDYLKAVKIPQPDIQRRSKTIFTAILHNYSDFNVLTIDKFMHKIIRSFTRELGLAMNFELESDVKTFVLRSIELLLDEVGEEKELTDYLIRFSEQLISDSEKGNVEKSLVELSNVLEKEEGKEAVKTLDDVELKHLISVQAEIKKKITELRTKIEAEAKTVLKVIDDNGIYLYDLLGKERGVAAIYKKVSQGNFDINLKALENKLKADEWVAKGKRADIKKAIESIADKLEYHTTNILNGIKEYGLQLAINKNFIGFSLLATIQKKLKSLKDQNNIVFLNDFNDIISNVIKNEPAPFIYEKIGNRYHYLLIDEFQDTSRLQWHNLVPLIYDSLSNGYENLIVGDAKQAIYRWRGGNVEQFVKLPEVEGDFHDINHINQLFEHFGKVDTLKDNYRSDKNVVEFNNYLFEAYHNKTRSPLIKEIYKNGSQNVKSKKEGYVSYQILLGSKKDIKEERLNLVLDYIRSCQKNNIKAGDIAILVRGRTDAMAITHFLSEHNVQVASGDSIVLSSSAEVNFMIAWFKHHYDANNQQASLQCLDFLKEEEKELTQVFDNYRTPDKKNNIYTKHIDLDKYIKEKFPLYNDEVFKKLNLYDKVIYLIEIFGLDRSDAYIDQFLNTVKQYNQKNTASLLDFIQYYEEKKDDIGVNMGEDSKTVSVLTIHKSKGLQYPVVIVPFADWPNKNNSSKDYVWVEHETIANYGLPRYVMPLKKEFNDYGLEQIYNKEEEATELENANLFYVAYTRAKNRLYIISRETSEKYKTKKEEELKNVYQILNLIATEHPDFDNENNRLELGQEESNEKKSKKQQIDNDSIPRVKTWRTKLSLSLSQEAQEKNKNLIEKEYGKAVHYVLSKITHPEDLEKQIEQAVQKQMIEPYVVEHLTRDLKKCFTNTKVKEWFSGKLGKELNEQAIVDETGKTYRPDRIILSNNRKKAIIIDYKTGSPNKKHNKQIKEYGNIIKELGYKDVELYLLYTGSQDVVEV